MGTGDADCRVASLLAMTVLILCHSEEAQRADVGIRPFYNGRGFGPPRSSAPTDAVWVVPSNGPMWSSAPTERNGSLPRLPGQRLAKRKARKEELVKFSLCPTSELCSTAYNVRKSQQSPARAPADVTSTEQNSLEPHPAARQGASRARNCAAKSVFSFDGSTAVFFLPPQKENGGGKPAGVARYPRLVNRPTAAGRAWGVASASQIPKRNLGRQSWSPRPTEVCTNNPSVSLRLTAPFTHGSLFPCGGRGTPFPAGVCCLRSGRQGRRVFSPWMGVSISGALNHAFRIWTAAGVMLAPAPAFSTTMATAISGSS